MAVKSETEAKFDADRDWTPPSSALLSGRAAETIDLTAEYWDTRDLRLDRRGVTLRHRRADDGSEDMWTLKLPSERDGEISTRDEVSEPGPPEAPPRRLTELVTAMTLGSDLTVAAVLHTQRRRSTLGGDFWDPAVEISDDSVSSVVDGDPGPSFRQIEVELLDPEARELFRTVTEELRSAGLEESEDPSKLHRVLRSVGPPPGGDGRGGDGSIEEVVQGATGRGLSAIVANDPALRLGDDPDAVHRCRVAVRRLRSDLKALRPVLRRSVVDEVRGELEWFGDLLGRVRDLHVMRDLVHDIGRVDPALPSTDVCAIDLVLARQVDVERTNLLSAMGGDRYTELLASLERMATAAPLRSGVRGDGRARALLREAAARTWKRARRERRRAGDHPDAERLHALRKKTKQARMTAQMARRHGLESGRFVQQAGSVKDQLGDLHDAEVLVDLLDRVQQRLDTSPAFTAGRLRERSAQRAQHLRSEWAQTWDDLDRKRLRAWMS